MSKTMVFERNEKKMKIFFFFIAFYIKTHFKNYVSQTDIFDIIILIIEVGRGIL